MEISVEYSLVVKAKVEKVWDILVDVGSWPRWQGTPFVKLSAPGPVKEGSTFIANLGGLKWDLVVTKAERPNKIVWVGQRMGLKGIHEWEFSQEDGKTRAITRESMTGWLLFLAYPIVKRRLSRTDEKWLADLKVIAEST